MCSVHVSSSSSSSSNNWKGRGFTHLSPAAAANLIVGESIHIHSSPAAAAAAAVCMQRGKEGPRSPLQQALVHAHNIIDSEQELTPHLFKYLLQ